MIDIMPNAHLDINRPDILREVDAAFDRYEQALVSNDVEVLDALFADAPQTLRYGATENLYGYDAIQAFRVGRPAHQLARAVTARVVTTYGDAFAVTAIEFRRDHEPRIGRQTQTWVKGVRGWQVVAAHVSWMG
jgi:hypothetical protein